MWWPHTQSREYTDLARMADSTGLQGRLRGLFLCLPAFPIQNGNRLNHDFGHRPLHFDRCGFGFERTFVFAIGHFAFQEHERARLNLGSILRNRPIRHAAVPLRLLLPLAFGISVALRGRNRQLRHALSVLSRTVPGILSRETDDGDSIDVHFGYVSFLRRSIWLRHATHA